MIPTSFPGDAGDLIRRVSLSPLRLFPMRNLIRWNVASAEGTEKTTASARRTPSPLGSKMATTDLSSGYSSGLHLAAREGASQEGNARCRCRPLESVLGLPFMDLLHCIAESIHSENHRNTKSVQAVRLSVYLPLLMSARARV